MPQSNGSGDKSFSYKDAGVDIDAGNALIDRIKPLVKTTFRPEVLTGLGGFGALFELGAGYQQPLLVSSTDGVGTKLRLAIDAGIHNTVGVDLVAMCVNDILVQGAEPLFFLDYFATGKLEVAVAESVISGIAEGCRQAGCALIGGETAEMPGMYQADDYDLAGFTVGVVEKAKLIDGSAIKSGDQIIALASSGPHSNGYSLVRQIISDKKIDLEQSFADKTLKEALLEPTRIYVKTIQSLLAKDMPLHGLAHITGGGLSENLPRVLPKHCRAVISRNAWQVPPIFQWLKEQGNIAQDEMLRTFNCGIGMVLVVPEAQADACLRLLQMQEETAWSIGQIAKRTEDDAAIEWID